MDRDVYDLNRELARRINEEAKTNPQSPYVDKFVGIANGEVVVVADDLDDMARRLRQIEPDPTKTFV
jgi:ubiquinone biosynthesis protein UbiJ